MTDTETLAAALQGKQGMIRASDVRILLGKSRISTPLKALGWRQMTKRRLTDGVGRPMRLYVKGNGGALLRLDLETGCFIHLPRKAIP